MKQNIFQLISLFLLVRGAQAGELPMIEKNITVNAPIEAVWHAWTTADGLKFVSRESRIELKPGGAYDWFLELPPDEQGARGSEGSRVLAFLPMRMIAFAWTFPPDVPSLRYAGKTSQVVVIFDELEDDSVRVSLTAHGFEKGDDWQKGRDYFDNAWQLVLMRLKDALENP